MDREHRAKQFAPFTALSGLEEALKAKKLPAILLSGEWLAKCNFNIGDHINVEVSDD